MSNTYTEQEILNRCFDGTDRLVADGTTSSGAGGAQRSAQDIWNLVFDDTNNLIKVV